MSPTGGCYLVSPRGGCYLVSPTGVCYLVSRTLLVACRASVPAGVFCVLGCFWRCSSWNRLVSAASSLGQDGNACSSPQVRHESGKASALCVGRHKHVKKSPDRQQYLVFGVVFIVPVVVFVCAWKTLMYLASRIHRGGHHVWMRGFLAVLMCASFHVPPTYPTIVTTRGGKTTRAGWFFRFF